MAPLIRTDFGGAPRIESVLPDVALPGAEVEVRGANLGPVSAPAPAAGGPGSWRRPVAMLGDLAAPVLMSRSRRLVVKVPEEAATGKLRILQNGATSNLADLAVGTVVATGIHAVASPAVDDEGNLYVTLSGQRGQETPVSVYRVGQDGEMRAFLSGIMNASGLAMGPDGYLYVSSRHEGTVYRVTHAGAASIYAEGMGVATGLAFDAEGNLYVGDRSGTIFKIAPDRQIFVFATLEPSVAAYHLAFGIDGTLYVSGPTTSANDAVYAIDQDGATTVFQRGLGRPQGLAVDVAGAVYVAASYGGRRGVVRIAAGEEPALVVSGSGIVGFTFVPGGSALVATGSSVYHVPLGIEGWRVV